MPNTRTISDYYAAGYPAVAISTSDEDRTIASVLASLPSTRQAWRIAATGGLIDIKTSKPVPGSTGPVSQNGQATPASFQTALEKIAASKDTVLVMLDYQSIIRNSGAYRPLRDALVKVRTGPEGVGTGSIIVLIAPNWKMPAELEHDIPVMQDSLPSREELGAALDICIQSTRSDVDKATRAKILDAASGLTLAEAEGAMALSFDGTGFVPEAISEEKMKLVRQSGYLEVSLPAKLTDLGGLGGLRRYVEQEVLPVMHQPDLRVKGIGSIGIPGGGKSLFARVLGSMVGWPVLRCDIGALKAGLVGESERNMREMLKLAEAVSPVILFLDELDKGAAGHKSSGQTDSGVLIGMIGTLLTWLQEHDSQIITFFTANNPDALPSDLMRAGRIDQVFFVDLPSLEERREIATVHLKKFGAVNDACAAKTAEITDKFTGAEIEQLVKSAARKTLRKITPESLVECVKDIKPISFSRADEIARLQEFGKLNLRLANTPVADTATSGRRIAANTPKPIVNKNLN